MSDSPNPYLAGNFAPVTDEISVEDLPVVGTLPPELDGHLVRNGPNPIAPADPATYHWFTGDGMLHAVHISGGSARSYRNRYVRTDRAAAALGEAPIPEQPTDTALGSENVANTHVVAHGGRLLALVEICLPTEVRADLSTVGRYDFGGLRTPMTAHPKTDPVTGELHFFGYDVFGPPYLRYHVADRDGVLTRTEEIEVPAATMMHDFAVTEEHVVFLDLPVVFDMDLVAKRGMPFRWDPGNGARVGVMARAGGAADVVWCEVEPCYVFHVLNAYDEGGEVVLDVCRYAHMFARDIHGVAGATPTLERWRVDPAVRKVRRETVLDLACEFPRVDDRLAGRRHRYGYVSAVGAEERVSFHGLRKVDLVAGSHVDHDFGECSAAGEGVFVPASAASREDEGYVMSVVYDRSAGTSDLVVIDAEDFAAPPVATVRLPRRVPFGFHGSWVPAGSLRN